MGLKLLTKNNLGLVEKAINNAIAYELGEGEQDVEALEEFGIAPRRFRAVAGFQVLSVTSRDEHTDTDAAERIDTLLRYRAQEFYLRAKLLRESIEPLAVIPLVAWEHICDQLKLYRFTPQGNIVRGASDQLVSTMRDFVEKAVAPIRSNKYHNWATFCGVATTLATFISGYINAYENSGFSWWSVIIPILAGLAVGGIGFAVISEYPESDEQANLEKKIAPSAIESLNQLGTLPELLWPQLKEPEKSTFPITITLPAPPQHIQEKLIALQKTRLPVHVAAAQDTIGTSFTLSGTTISAPKTEQETYDRYPIMYVVKDSAVAIIDQYGEFPVDPEIISGLINADRLI